MQQLVWRWVSRQSKTPLGTDNDEVEYQTPIFMLMGSVDPSTSSLIMPVVAAPNGQIATSRHIS